MKDFFCVILKLQQEEKRGCALIHGVRVGRVLASGFGLVET